MRPFWMSDKCKLVREPYPNAVLLRDVLTSISQAELQLILRLLFSEGAPFAFRLNPVLYENVREWMGVRLQVHPKTITLIGSARIGYSTSPAPKYGQDFDRQSDLDFLAVDEGLFSKVVDDYNKWESDVDDGRVVARNAREQEFWNENLRRVPSNIVRGFVDPYLIPSWNRYSQIVNIMDTLYLVHKRLKVTPQAPPIRKASLRVYKDWRAFFHQFSLNISILVASFAGSRLTKH